MVDGQYVRVLDVPQEQWDRTGNPHFNRYQYPALFLGYEVDDVERIIPFYYDTLFSGVWGDGNNLLEKNVFEITREQFEKEFNRRIDEFKQKIFHEV